MSKLKLKTNRGAAKRFRVSASGKLKFRGANRNHILTKKSRKRKNRMGKEHYVNPADQKGIERLLQGS